MMATYLRAVKTSAFPRKSTNRLLGGNQRIFNALQVGSVVVLPILEPGSKKLSWMLSIEILG